MRKLTFRIDDITPKMNWDSFEYILDILNSYNIKPLLGVVPDCADDSLSQWNLNDKFWDRIRELENKGYTIAMHGFQHIYDSSDSGILKYRHKSEFAGHSYDVQLEKLKKAKKIFKENGIDVKIFMAPGHTFDLRTLKALKQIGIQTVTDGYSVGNYKYKEILFVPCWLPTKYLPFKKGVGTICIHTNKISKEFIDSYIIDICELNNVIDFEKALEEPVLSRISLENILIKLYFKLLNKYTKTE